MRSKPLVTALTLVAALLIPSIALADALVVVEVRTPDGDPAEGTVTLRSLGEGSERTYQCTTTDGTCRIDSVPGGQYTVTLEPASGAAPAPRRAMIPPAGTVTLRVATGG